MFIFNYGHFWHLGKSWKEKALEMNAAIIHLPYIWNEKYTKGGISDPAQVLPNGLEGLD